MIITKNLNKKNFSPRLNLISQFESVKKKSFDCKLKRATIYLNMMILKKNRVCENPHLFRRDC